jgi:hypothetical protein
MAKRGIKLEKALPTGSYMRDGTLKSRALIAAPCGAFRFCTLAHTLILKSNQFEKFDRAYAPRPSIFVSEEPYQGGRRWLAISLLLITK